MLAWGKRKASRRSLYSGTGAPRLCRLWRCFAGVATLCCGFAAAACSIQLNPLSSRDQHDVEHTGSIGGGGQGAQGSQASQAAQASQGSSQGSSQGLSQGSSDAAQAYADQPGRIAVQPSEADLVYAREAVADALGRGGKDISVPWENPNSGAGGNITPLANSYTDGGLPCRDFLASYVHGGAQDWLEGVACRTSRGNWEVKRLKPLKQV